MSESQANDENTPPIHVLLPICMEAKIDVFFKILNSILLHTRLHDKFHIDSLISGMNGETVIVDTEDLSVDWQKLTTDSRQIRQSKLIGVWAARHYPLIGKKLIGSDYEPPKKYNIQTTELTEFTEEEIVNIVSKKMKLRVIQVKVCKNTLSKLKHFVRAPMGIGLVNVTTLSSKMIAFDIESEYIATCWQALKGGGFPSDFQPHMNSTTPEIFKVPQQSFATIDQHQIIRRNSDQIAVEKEVSSETMLPDVMSSSGKMSHCKVLLTKNNPGSTKCIVTNEPKFTAKRMRRVSPINPNMREGTNLDTLRLAVFEIQKDVRNFTKYLDANNENTNESTFGSERFHLAVFKQKDAEISKLTECLQRLEEKVKLLNDDKSKLNSDIEAKSNLINALNKVVETDSKFHGKMEEESKLMAQKLASADELKIVMTQEIDKLQAELTKVKSRLAHFDSNLQCEKEDLVQNLSVANQLNCELTETNGKLHAELNVAKNHSGNENYILKLSAAEEVKNKLTEANAKLQEDLSAANNHFINMEWSLKCQIQDLAHKLSAADQTNIDFTDTNGRLQQELNAAKDHASNMSGQIHELSHKLSVAERVIIESTETTSKLQQELNSARDLAANMETNLKSQIHHLTHKLSATERINIELTDTKSKLEQQLSAAKTEAEENDKLSETLQNLKARSNDLVEKFQSRLEETEKINANLAGENEKLRGELSTFKQKAAEDVQTLELNSMLPNRPEISSLTDRKEFSDTCRGYDQSVSKENNIAIDGVQDDNYVENQPEAVDRADADTESYSELQADRPKKESDSERAAQLNDCLNDSGACRYESQMESKMMIPSNADNKNANKNVAEKEGKTCAPRAKKENVEVKEKGQTRKTTRTKATKSKARKLTNLN